MSCFVKALREVRTASAFSRGCEGPLLNPGRTSWRTNSSVRRLQAGNQKGWQRPREKADAERRWQRGGGSKGERDGGEREADDRRGVDHMRDRCPHTDLFARWQRYLRIIKNKIQNQT